MRQNSIYTTNKPELQNVGNPGSQEVKLTIKPADQEMAIKASCHTHWLEQNPIYYPVIIDGSVSPDFYSTLHKNTLKYIHTMVPIYIIMYSNSLTKWSSYQWHNAIV